MRLAANDPYSQKEHTEIHKIPKFMLRICLFRYMCCRNLAKLVFLYSFSLLLLTMFSVSHVYSRQIAHLHCVCPSHRGCLTWVKFVKIRSKNLKASLTTSSPLFSDKARCFS